MSKKCHIFEDFSILTEKQQPKPKNSSSLKFSASSDTQFAPNGARLVEWNDSGGKYPCVRGNLEGSLRGSPGGLYNSLGRVLD